MGGLNRGIQSKKSEFIPDTKNGVFRYADEKILLFQSFLNSRQTLRNFKLINFFSRMPIKNH